MEVPGGGISPMRSRAALVRRLGHVGNFYKRKPLGGFGATVAIIFVIVAIFGPQMATHDPRETNPNFVFASPGTGAYWLGGDDLGRDVYSRLMHAAKISLRVGLLSVFFGVTAGFLIGITSGYFGGKFDLVVQRLVDAMMAFPGLLLALAIIAALGTSERNVIIALTIGLVPTGARVIRSQALSIKETDYVLAARAVGANHLRIILRHMAPNCVATYIVLATLSLGVVIVAEASLSFLGMGVPPDVPTWGGMLNGATEQWVSLAPWLSVWPGLAIVIVVLAWNLLGDSLRDVLDPRLRGTG